MLGAPLGFFAGGLLGYLALAIGNNVDSSTFNWNNYGEILNQGILVSPVIGACLGGYLLARDIAKRGAAE